MNAHASKPSVSPEETTARRNGREPAIILSAMAASLLYATARYNIFKKVPWADWPIYTVNKALALAALILMLASLRGMIAGRRIGRVMMWAGTCAFLHIILSLTLLDPAYYPKFFAGAKLNATAGISLLIGAAAAVAMELGARKSGSWSSRQRVRTLAAIALAGGLHAAIPGTGTWFAPADWPGGLPPITLISFGFGLAAAGLVWKART
jgi:hypothetical protein